MDNQITYLNTDLDLKSGFDLHPLSIELSNYGLHSLHVTHCEDGFWYATFETEQQHEQPETNIAEMVAAIERLTEPHLSTWQSCVLREFNIGYDCGEKPWAFNQGLSNELLQRIAKIGASIRFTMYPDRSQSKN